jgi:hypothetical protein
LDLPCGKEAFKIGQETATKRDLVTRFIEQTRCGRPNAAAAQPIALFERQWN